MTNRIGIIGRTVDLYVQFVDAAGNPANADTTPQVQIYDSTGTQIRALSNIGVGLAKEQTGLYHLSFDIPETASDGYANDRWVAEIGGVEVENTFEFLITSSGNISESYEPVFTPGDSVEFEFTEAEVYGINILMKMFNCRVKNNGTRKVRQGNQYIEVPCSIFTDDEVICFLKNSLSSFNQYPHFTNFSFADPQIYGVFAEIIVQGAVLLALAAQALIEKGKEFQITDNGVTYQPPQVADMLNTIYGS